LRRNLDITMIGQIGLEKLVDVYKDMNLKIPVKKFKELYDTARVDKYDYLVIK